MLNEQDSHMAMSAISHAADMVKVSMQQAICNYQDPHVMMRPKIYQDGNQWCALYGANIQEGVCGFGDTPSKACHDFDKNWYGQKLQGEKV